MLRGRSRDEQFISACSRLGVRIPRRPLQPKAAARVTLWISPDEFLHLLPLSSLEEFIKRAESSPAGLNAAVVDNSGSYSYLRLGQAERLLARLRFYDLKGSLPAAKAVSTFVARAPAILFRPPSDETAIRMLVRFSCADYVWRMPEQTARQPD